MARDWRDDRIAELEARVQRLEALVEELRAERAELRRENAELKEKLGKSSRNSSKPPSSDGPAERHKRRGKKPTGRSPGGQPGHNKHERPEVPPEKVSKRVVLRPDRCAKCAKRLVGSDPEPHRHQVFELPEIEPIVTEYLLHLLHCPDCGHATRAKLPEGVPTRIFGPSVKPVGEGEPRNCHEPVQCIADDGQPLGPESVCKKCWADNRMTVFSLEAAAIPASETAPAAPAAPEVVQEHPKGCGCVAAGLAPGSAGGGATLLGGVLAALRRMRRRAGVRR